MPKFNLGWLKDKNGEKFAPKTFLSQILNNDGSLFKDRVESIENKLTEHDNKIVNNEVITNHEDRITQNTNSIANNTNDITTLTGRIAQNESNISSLTIKVNDNADSITDLETRVTNHEKRYSQSQFILTDTVNGYDYIIQMQNGNLVSFCKVTEIRIDKMPDKTSYFVGESFDSTGMVVTAVCQDGTIKEITNYTCSDIIDGVVTITYQEANAHYNISINVTILKIEDVLIDFEYTTNDDGTYTITKWKQTLNGNPSTEMIVPDSNLIRM